MWYFFSSLKNLGGGGSRLTTLSVASLASPLLLLPSLTGASSSGLGFSLLTGLLWLAITFTFFLSSPVRLIEIPVTFWLILALIYSMYSLDGINYFWGPKCQDWRQDWWAWPGAIEEENIAFLWAIPPGMYSSTKMEISSPDLYTSNL